MFFTTGSSMQRILEVMGKKVLNYFVIAAIKKRVSVSNTYAVVSLITIIM